MSAANNTSYTPLERVLTSLSFKEPDRVPFFLLLTTHGARELSMSIKDYFSDAQAVAEGQIRMQQRYGHDCLYAFTYAAIETEAWGGSVLFTEDGPPNAGAPIIHRASDIDTIRAPQIGDCANLQRNLRAISLMKERVGSSVPIIGVVMSPFSVPIMQMGFPAYLDLLHEDSARFESLMAANEDFCVRWANAQLEAGATAICYFDPLSSTDMIPRAKYLETGHKIACRVIAQIKGATAIHLASGRGLTLVDPLVQAKTAIMGLSSQDNLVEAKKKAAGRISLLGNLDGITMRRWTAEDAVREVKQAIADGARGGGFILSDNHGEVHWSVPESVLEAIADAVKTWGRYPLSWLS
ncbi:MAG: uroporphyrinogen decarboxylase family protein [Spirochaetes bacterium]|nr:uroporphyrinogen decarboxylase family protein [Spirochaetota bacterium]MBU0955218.1 uroporphyrinogen decarboxylase family protein [Spirochaetota bacterium]